MVWLLTWLHARAPGPSVVSANLRDLTRRKAAATVARPKDAKLGALYDTFIARLTEGRTASGARKINARMKIGATSAAADASSRSARAFSAPKAGLLKRAMSAPAGARVRKQTKIGNFGVGAVTSDQIVAAQHAVDVDMSRLVYGKDLSFAFAEWPLVEQLARSLLKAGAVYTNAHYLHANTETIVGHTTLATGATPSVHGMIGNAWFDREDGRLAYNIEDPEHPLLPTRENAATGAQVDPAQAAARSSGRSPLRVCAHLHPPRPPGSPPGVHARSATDCAVA